MKCHTDPLMVNPVKVAEALNEAITRARDEMVLAIGDENLQISWPLNV